MAGPSAPCLKPGVGIFLSVCVCAVRLLSITYNNMQGDAGTVSSVTVQTHTTANRSLGVSSVLPLSCYFLPLATIQTFYRVAGCVLLQSVWFPLTEKCDESQDKPLKQHSTRIWQVKTKL